MRAKNKTLNPVELDYMKILWKSGSASVQEVQDALPAKKRTRYTTILTMLKVMEKKGYVAHKEKNRTYYYHPILSEQKAKTNVIKDVVKSIFDGKPGELILNLVKEEKLSEKEIQEIKKAIRREGKDV